MEGDLYNLYRKSTPGEFQSTPSVWRETVYGISGNVDLNISIHSLRMEGDDITFLHFDVQSISIHSLRMEGDNRIKHKPHLGIIISIHSLRMEGDG